jgi:hypothetical protein
VSPADEVLVAQPEGKQLFGWEDNIKKWFIKKGRGRNLINFAQYACRTKGGIVVDTIIKKWIS